jgi:hypothetical protein
MPVATCIPDLMKMTMSALEAKHSPIILEEVGIQMQGEMWVSMQFCAKNLASAIGLNYTCALNLLHKVQQRTLRATSVDANYVAAAYKYIRSYGRCLHTLLEDAHSDFVVVSASCDDKFKVCDVDVRVSMR